MTHDALVRFANTDGMLIGLTQGQVAIVDAEDYQWLIAYKWRAQYDKDINNFYAVRDTPCDKNGKRKFIRMHREIMAANKHDHVDHGSHETLDNRKTNLKLVTGRGNMMNKLLYKNSTSGVCGVSWNKRDNKWVAYIRVEGRMLHLGSYSNRDEAIAARQCANAKYGFHSNHGQCWAELEGGQG